MAIDRYSITFRVIHPQCRHAEIAEGMGMHLKSGHTAGEPRQSTAGGAVNSLHGETVAAFGLYDREDGYFVDGLRGALELIESRRSYLHGLVESGGRLLFYVGVFVDEHVGFKLDNSLLESLSSLRIELDVEVYAG